jgi:hypothetical protein
LVAHHVAEIDLLDVGSAVLVSALASIVIAAKKGQSNGNEHGLQGDLS